MRTVAPSSAYSDALRASGGAQVASNFGTSGISSLTGGGAAFNNMQPSLALLYCQKQ